MKMISSGGTKEILGKSNNCKISRFPMEFLQLVMFGYEYFSSFHRISHDIIMS